MNKPPAFQFYPKDFLSDINVVSMNMEERGIYITLLSICWLEGWLPNGSTKLQRLCGNPSGWNEAWLNIEPCFYENDGKLYHKRLQIEREKQLKWREKSKIGGIKSGESRGKTKGGSTKLKPKANTSSSSSSSSSFASSSSPKKEEILFDVEKKEFINIKKEDIEIWKEAFPACDVNQELKKMIAWLLGDWPKRRKSAWKRFITGWLSRAQDHGGTKGIPQKSNLDDWVKEDSQ